VAALLDAEAPRERDFPMWWVGFVVSLDILLPAGGTPALVSVEGCGFIEG